MKDEGMNEEERSVLWLTLTLLGGGAMFKLLLLWCPDCKILDLFAVICLGLGAGSTASVTASWIQRKIRDRKKRDHFGKYEGVWERECLFQYAYGTTPRGRDTAPDGKKIMIRHAGDRTLHLDVDYGPGRGEVKASVEFDSDRGTIGEGTYVYVKGDLKAPTDNQGYAHSGKYTIHLFPVDDPDTIRAYYDGLMPDHNARGYEIWVRKLASNHP